MDPGGPRRGDTFIRGDRFCKSAFDLAFIVETVDPIAQSLAVYATDLHDFCPCAAFQDQRKGEYAP